MTNCFDNAGGISPRVVQYSCIARVCSVGVVKK